jgi:uncharacterized Zn-finger protein
MDRVFWATCPACKKAFIVAWELRHGDKRLICPYCGHRFPADEAAALDERA